MELNARIHIDRQYIVFANCDKKQRHAKSITDFVYVKFTLTPVAYLN